MLLGYRQKSRTTVKRKTRNPNIEIRNKNGSSQEFGRDLQNRNAFFAFGAASRIRKEFGYNQQHFLLEDAKILHAKTTSD
jgi:hypothetical protein